MRGHEIADTVQLSNKHCPRYYTRARPSAVACCPPGRCWYDEQAARRAEGKLALTPAAWLAAIQGEAEDDALDAAASAAGLRRITVHGLRHSWNDALRQVSAGEVTRAITGHVTERMTEHYSHVGRDEKKDAAARALRLVKGGAG